MSTSSVDLRFNLIIEKFNIHHASKNENFRDAVQFVTHSFIKAGFPNNDYHIKGIKDVCLWVGFCFPDIDKDVYMLYTLLIAYLSVVDDACDRGVDNRGFFRQELLDHIRFLSGEQDGSRISNPSLTLSAEIKECIQNAFSTVKSERLIDGCKDFFKYSHDIAEMWVSGASPSLEQYEQVRQVDSMAKMLLDMSLIYSTSSPRANPVSMFANERTIQGYTLATRCCSIMNDIASMGKDIEDDITNNYVFLLSKEEKVDITQATIISIDRVLNSFEELKKLPIDLVIKESMIRIVEGYICWCCTTPRFHHQKQLISYLCKCSPSSSSRLTSQVNQVTYLDQMFDTLQPEPPTALEKPKFKDVFKGQTSMELRVSYYEELAINHLLNLIPFALCILMNAGYLSITGAFLIQQLATIAWTLSLHTLIHSHCRNELVNDLSDITLGLGYFGIFTPTIAKYGHQTHHSYTETDEDFDYYFFKTNGIVKLLLKSTLFSEYYIARYYQENKATSKTTSILISKFAVMILLYTLLGTNYLLILLFSRIASSYLFASFTTLVHSVDMIQFLNTLEAHLNNFFGCDCKLDNILVYFFSYNIHVVKYHCYHHDYPWVCPSKYCPTLTELHPSSSSLTTSKNQ